MTTTATPTTPLTLTGAQWRALDTHRATERTRYAMEYAAWLPATDKSRAWLGADGVVCATDGKRVIYLPAPAASAVSLLAIPRVSKAKRAQSDTYPSAPMADGTEGRYFPPTLDVIPGNGATGLEIPTDSLRALFAPFATDPDNDTARCWFGAGIRLSQRNVDVNMSATWGNAPSDDHDPIGLGAAYVLAVCDAADLLGAGLVTIRAEDHRSAVSFDLASKALALVMPRVLA